MDDQQAIERYRYMLRTAPPDDIERAHAEAFERLTPEQRQMALQQLATEMPASEMPRSDDPQSLARLATRAEMRQPGTIERTFSRMPAGPGLGGMFLSTLAGAFVGSAIYGQMFGDHDGGQDAAAADQSGADGTQDAGSDTGYGDTGVDSGSDFGGGDFGGGDFGGI